MACYVHHFHASRLLIDRHHQRYLVIRYLPSVNFQAWEATQCLHQITSDDSIYSQKGIIK